MALTNILAVIPTLFAQGTSLHTVVLPVFCAFLAFQLYLFLSHRWAVVRQRNILETLWQQGCAPEHELTQGRANRQWLGWVATRFHDGAFNDGHYSREDVLAQLDNWLEGHGSYLFLQRMGIMAPLVGLLITVIGFFFLQTPTADSGDLKQILYSLTPLVLGVGTGATLALINQLLLHLAGKGTDNLRTVACRWFDDCVWKHVQTKPHVAANNAAEALQSMADIIHGSIGSFRDSTAAISHTSHSLEVAGGAVALAAGQLQSQMAGISGEMKDLQATAKNVVNSANGIAPAVEAVTTDLAESVKMFKTVVQVQLGQAATRHQESADLFAHSVEQICESAAQLNAQFGSFGQIVNAQATAGQEWSRSLQEDILPAQQSFRQAGAQLVDATKDLVPTQRAFRDAVDSMQGSANGLAEFVRKGVEPATRRLAELDQVLTRMQETTEAVRQMTELRQEFAGLARSLSQAAATAEAIRSLPQEIRTVLQTLVPNHNGDAGPRRPFFLRLFGGFASNGRSNGRR
ncbi:MAG: methyl-accepting chemotaxis protein [Thermoguttaceae bacterium]